MKSQLEEIINSPISTPQQKAKAQELLDLMKPSAPVASTGNMTLTGTYKIFKGVHVPPEIVNFTVVVSPEYFTELQKKWPCQNGQYSNQLANDAHFQRLSAGVDFFLERFDPKKQQLLLPAARAKFPDFDTYIQERSSMKSEVLPVNPGKGENELQPISNTR